MTTLVLSSILVLGAARQDAVTLPKNITDAVAGLSVTKSIVTQTSWFDKKSGFYAIKTYSCDGGHVYARLTRDRRIVEDEGYEVLRFGKHDPERKLPSEHSFPLSTKNGITIGMSTGQVSKLLGKPIRTSVNGSKKQYTSYLYRYIKMFDKEEGIAFRNTYIFKSGKLIEILITKDAIPGCCTDGRSEEGWPWTRF